jgi:drug/metabolite transporter (DMT)-like permease
VTTRILLKTIVLCRVALASIILLAIVYFKGDKIPSSPGLWSAFLIMGALNNLIPVSAILLGVVVLGERLAWNAFAGMGLIFIGLIAVDGRLLKTFKRREDV